MSSFVLKASRLPITQLATALARAYGVTPPTRRQLWDAAVSGRYPCEQTPNGRWSIAPADLPLVAAAMGLVDRLDHPASQPAAHSDAA